MSGPHRTKKTTALVMAVVMIGLAFILTTNALAEDAWYNCTIVRMGGRSTSDTSPVYVMLSDTRKTFKNKYFRIPEGRLNEIMAVLLTAASNSARVRILGDPDIPKDSQRLLKAAYYLP